MLRTRRPKALVTSPMRGPGFDLLRDICQVVYDPWIDQNPLRIYDADQLAARAKSEGAQILVVEADRCAGPVFDLPLLAIASTRGDPNNVDIQAATEAGVPVLSAPGRNADAVAELTVGLMLCATRGVTRADRDVRAGEIYRDGTIPYQRFRAWQLAGRTAGIVGLGAVGKALEWRLRGLGMRVVCTDPYAPEATLSLDGLLAVSDVVSLHAPVTAQTKGMIGAREFSMMRDGVVFVNTARAQLHDTDALVEALQSGKVAAAALDHFEGEYLDPNHPLTSFDNVVLSPHIGGATYDTEVNQAQAVADGLCRLLCGAVPANLVNPQVIENARRLGGSDPAHGPRREVD